MSRPSEQLSPDLPSPAPGCLATRHVVTIMLFLGMACAYTMKTNMSVAIVAMVNQTALPRHEAVVGDECRSSPANVSLHNPQHHKEGQFLWDSAQQGYVLSSFFYGYVVTQIPLGILAKKYGAKWFLGGGMLINSVFGLLVPTAAIYLQVPGLIFVRFVQGLGEGPIVPCTHALLAKWIPPNERSRVGAIVYAGAQFGTVISMPISGLLSASDFMGGWPSVFYFFGLISLVWTVLFLFVIYEDPECHPRICQEERKHILTSVFGAGGVESPPIPWKSILRSVPFYAIIVAHIGQNYGYETLMTELPSYMKQVLHFNTQDNGLLSSLPYLAMWIFSICASFLADYFISRGHSRTLVRKVANAFGLYGPAVALVVASYTGCNPYLTVAILTMGVGLNGGIYSGFKISHLDISPRFAGILMSFTNCLANAAGALTPVVAGHIVLGRPTQAAWREVFFAAAGVYVVCNTFYLIFGSSERQPWDNPELKRDQEKNGTQTTKFNSR